MPAWAYWHSYFSRPSAAMLAKRLVVGGSILLNLSHVCQAALDRRQQWRFLSGQWKLSCVSHDGLLTAFWQCMFAVSWLGRRCCDAYLCLKVGTLLIAKASRSVFRSNMPKNPCSRPEHSTQHEAVCYKTWPNDFKNPIELIVRYCKNDPQQRCKNIEYHYHYH